MDSWGTQGEAGPMGSMGAAQPAQGPGQPPPGQVPPKQPVYPSEVFTHPVPSASTQPQHPCLFLPSFPRLMGRMDSLASRVPWWLWLVAGALAWRFFAKKGGVKMLSG